MQSDRSQPAGLLLVEPHDLLEGPLPVRSAQVSYELVKVLIAQRADQVREDPSPW